MRRPAAGFTLMELLVFVGLMGLVVSAVGHLSASALSMHMRQARRNHAQLAVLDVRERLLRDVMQAHHISRPFPGSGSRVLEGYIGRLDTGLAASPWVNAFTGSASGQYIRFLYCVDERDQLWYYRDTWGLGTTAPAPAACGQGGGRLLAGRPLEVKGLSSTLFTPGASPDPNLLFWRGAAPFPGNVVNVGMDLALPPSADAGAGYEQKIQLTLAASFPSQAP